VCTRESLWLHVDAAMCGIAGLCPELRWVHDGVEAADSYCTNPHKWMGVNFDCDLLYVADRSALIDALSILPAYLQTAQAGRVIDYRDWQVPLGRRFRALKLWFAMRCEGPAPYQAMIRDHVAWAQEVAAWARADDRFDVVAPHPLNLVCVALRAGDEATDQLAAAANATGQALFTRSVVDGRSVVRFCIGGRTTQRHHVEEGWRLLSSLAG
jgi:aromatic-L-amino-acid decarboxylase